MISSRRVVVAAASLRSAVIAVPPALRAEPPPPNTTGKDSADTDNNKKKHRRDNDGGNNGNNGNVGKPQLGTKPNNGKPVGNMPMKTPGPPDKKAGGVQNPTLGVTKPPVIKPPVGQNTFKAPPGNTKNPNNANRQPFFNTQPGNPAAVNK
ncbi:MAG: hypothetical protein ACRD5Z_08595, partial [Bryobacteraceae bacterium]